jgi:hypothetical protein
VTQPRASTASKATQKRPQTRASTGAAASPPRVRTRLRTIDDVRAELARLYREGKAGKRDVSHVSKLANVLFILGRMIEGADYEERLRELEDQLREQRRRDGDQPWSARH